MHLQVEHILDELVIGGLVLETNMQEVLTRFEELNKLERSEVSPLFLALPLPFLAALHHCSSIPSLPK